MVSTHPVATWRRFSAPSLRGPDGTVYPAPVGRLRRAVDKHSTAAGLGVSPERRALAGPPPDPPRAQQCVAPGGDTGAVSLSPAVAGDSPVVDTAPGATSALSRCRLIRRTLIYGADD